MKRLFHGGVHPADKKELTSKGKDLRKIDPEYVIIPMSQHIGVPCKPLVKEGDHVKMGQKIGDNEGLCAPVHASVSGRVSAIKPMPHTSGRMVDAVIIENDHQYTWQENMVKRGKRILRGTTETMTQSELFQIIREAGIVGMGGATFPTEVKAESSQDKIDTLIINACECEPYITADDFYIRKHPAQILKGAMLLSNALQPVKIFLAIEENKKKAIEVLQKYIGEYPRITLKVLPVRYPQGAEKQLIRSLTGREVPPGSLPASVGCAVFNVSTAGAIYQAVYEGIPLISRIVTVTGEAVSEPQNFIVPIGTPFQVLIDAAGGLKTDNCRIIAGGPMMGRAQTSQEVSVIKGTGSVLCITDKGPERCSGEWKGNYFTKLWRRHQTGCQAVPPTCIRCGSCVEVCPMNLQPLYLYRYGKSENQKMLGKLNIMDCMECGCCAYVCPGKISLVEHIRSGKLSIKEGKKA